MSKVPSWMSFFLIKMSFFPRPMRKVRPPMRKVRRERAGLFSQFNGTFLMLFCF